MIWRSLLFSFVFSLTCGLIDGAEVERKYASSDSLSGYVHWIDLYDAGNTKINLLAENPKPYSPAQTCGRCHDFDTISHGWHFNAVAGDSQHGRPGQPWIWSDSRTGTHLPLSYRSWSGTFQPEKLGISRWEITAKFGGYLPGGGPGSKESLAINPTATGTPDRSRITGPLPVDCMICHRNLGSGYSPFVWTEQIDLQNFPFAPTVALGIATIDGNLKRLKDDFDSKAAGAETKLPKLAYDPQRFRNDGKVFFDLVRKPRNDACYYCHSNIAADSVTGNRWLHEEDIHVRAGIACADCHRNGLDHHTVRGFEGESRAAGTDIASLSCQGCHLGNTVSDNSKFTTAGRMGAPRPAHRGIPPLHFDKLSCTTCHSGPVPQSVISQQVNSIAHRLGEHLRRTGNEAPALFGPVAIPINHSITTEGQSGSQQKYTPHRMMWPSYWGTIADSTVTPLHPDKAYDLLKKTLKVRRDFSTDLGETNLTLAQRTEVLGIRASAKPEELTTAEIEKIAAAEAEVSHKQVRDRLSESLALIETTYAEKQAVFISGGTGFVRSAEGAIEDLSTEMIGKAASPYAWPIAHNVRPATQSWGVTGCVECHRDGSEFFSAEVQPIGLLPGQVTKPIPVHEMQHADMVRLHKWNEMFAGRSLFKIAGLIALGLTILICTAAFVWNIGSLWRRICSAW